MENQNEQEIDLLDLLFFLKKKVLVILAAFLLCAGLGLFATVFMMDTEYTANTRIYILNRTSETNVSYSDFQVSNQLLDDYVVLITGENVTKKLISQMGLDLTHSQLVDMISVTAPSDTRVLQISVTDTSAERAANIANTVREIASVQIKEIMAVDAVNLVYEAAVPQTKSGPSVSKNTLIGGLAGLVLAVGVYVVIYLLDDTLRTEEDVEKHLGLSVLGVIPVSTELENMAKNGQSKASASKSDAKRVAKN